jgi:hypothetical protein
MLIAKIEAGVITAVADYHDLFPNTSFSSGGPSTEFLEQNSCKPVSVFKPHDRTTQKLAACEPYQEGAWVYTVQVVPQTAQDLQAALDNTAVQIRAQRNQLLSASDWTQGKDIPNVTSAAWATYRQALRDITAQAGFPATVTWPEPPTPR